MSQVKRGRGRPSRAGSRKSDGGFTGDFGAMLYKLRSSTVPSLTLEDIERRTGGMVLASSLARYEKGQGSLGLASALAIAYALGVEIQDIIPAKFRQLAEKDLGKLVEYLRS